MQLDAPKPTADERAAAGKAARAGAPRSAAADWTPPEGRADPVAVLEGQAESRLPELVPIRHGRMLASPLAFYRGAAAIMAGDLAGLPRGGFDVQLCGDAHLSNFGAFAAPDRELVFDVNDFDETLPGPWEWDLLRLAASFEIAARDRGFDGGRGRALAETAARSYREALRDFAARGNLDVWYRRLRADDIRARWEADASQGSLRELDRRLAKMRRKNSLRAFEKLTEVVDGRRRIVSQPPLLMPLDELYGDVAEQAQARLSEIVESYHDSLPDDRRLLLEGYRFVDAARKVVGVGSVGTRAWIVLLIGRDENDPLFLQVKEAQRSVVEPFTEPSRFENQGQRVVEGQRRVQSASDIFLGWLIAEDLEGVRRDFYVRQLWDSKGSVEIETMRARTLAGYAEMCGSTLARAHARTGDRFAIAGYLGKSTTLDRAVGEFAVRYADCNERDFEALRQAVADGRVAAEPEL